MRDGVALWRRISLAERKPKISPVLIYDILSTRASSWCFYATIYKTSFFIFTVLYTYFIWRVAFIYICMNYWYPWYIPTVYLRVNSLKVAFLGRYRPTGSIMTSLHGNAFCLPVLCEGNHGSPMDSDRKGKFCGALMRSLLLVRTSCWTSRQIAFDLRHHDAHVTEYDDKTHCLRETAHQSFDDCSSIYNRTSLARWFFSPKYSKIYSISSYGIYYVGSSSPQLIKSIVWRHSSCRQHFDIL